MQNRYLEKFYDLPDGWKASMQRGPMVEKYAWAIPCEAALAAIAELNKPIVEIGAGSAYWARLLSERGVKVYAYDKHPPLKRKANGFRHRRSWHPTYIGNERKVRKHPNCALFLCWPYMDDTALNCVRQYKGDTVIYIGEGGYGCTANEAFFEEMWENWEDVKGVNLPQWDSIHDHLTIYKRR